MHSSGALLDFRALPPPALHHRAPPRHVCHAEPANGAGLSPSPSPTPQLRATLQALRERRREREMTSFYSTQVGERPAAVLPPTSGSPEEEVSWEAVVCQELVSHLTPCSQALRHVEMVQLRTRLNSRLSKANAYARFCDLQVEQRNQVVVALFDELQLCRQDVESIRAAMRNTVESSAQTIALDVLARAEALAARVSSALELADEQRVRPVSVAWTGMASDVRIMGSFDTWTRGFALTPDQSGTWTTWRATLNLLPGTYEVKFLIDSANWRIAADWAIVGEGDSANNLLVV